MLCALIQDNKVTAIQDLDDAGYQSASKTCQIVIDISAMTVQPQVGWTFDGSNLNPPPGTLASMKITKLAFRERFTIGEMTGIYSAMSSNFTLQAMIGNQQVATYVDLSRSDTIAGVMYLVSIGLITSARATQILTTAPTSTEVYTG